MAERERCWATSWPFTVNDTRCVRDEGHEGAHRDQDGYEWGGNGAPVHDMDLPTEVFMSLRT